MYGRHRDIDLHTRLGQKPKRIKNQKFKNICYYYLNMIATFEQEIAAQACDWKENKQAQTSTFTSKLKHHQAKEEFAGSHLYRPCQHRVCWKKTSYHTNKLITWEYVCPSKTREKRIKQGLVGTDGRIVIKIIDENSYELLTTEEVIKRGHLICDAVLNSEVMDFILDSAKKKWLSPIIAKAKKIFEQKIKKEGDINQIHVGNHDQFKQKYRGKIEDLFAELILALAKQLQRVTQYQYSLEEMVAAINRAEQSYEIECGRPLQIYLIKQANIPAKMVIAQFPQNKENQLQHSFVSKKSIFDSLLPLQEEYIVHYTAIVAEKAEPEQIEQTIATASSSATTPTTTTSSLSATPFWNKNCLLTNSKRTIYHRHSASLAVEDELIQLYYAYQAVIEKVLQGIKNKIGNKEYLNEEEPINQLSMMLTESLSESDSEQSSRRHDAKNKKKAVSRSQPMTLNLSSLMLIGANLNKQTQLECTALDMARYRLNQEAIKIFLHEKKLYVEPRVVYLLAPLNAKALHGKEAEKIHEYNARSFYDFHKKISKRILAKLREPENEVYNQAKTVFSQFENKHYHLEKKIGVEEAMLGAQYAKYLQCVEEYIKLMKAESLNKQALALKKKSIVDEYKEAQKAIRSTEKNLFNLYQDANQLLKEIFSKNKKNIEALQQTLDQALSSECAKKDKSYYLLFLRFLRVQEMYYQDVRQSTAYHFQANYLLCFQQAHVDVEIRNNRQEKETNMVLQQHLLAYQLFNQAYNRDPNLSNQNDVIEYQKKFLYAKQWSTSNNQPSLSGVKQLANQLTSGRRLATKMAGQAIVKAKKQAAWQDISFSRSMLIGLSVGIVLAISLILLSAFGFGTPMFIGFLGGTLLLSIASGLISTTIYSILFAFLMASAMKIWNRITRPDSPSFPAIQHEITPQIKPTSYSTATITEEIKSPESSSDDDVTYSQQATPEHEYSDTSVSQSISETVSGQTTPGGGRKTPIELYIDAHRPPTVRSISLPSSATKMGDTGKVDTLSPMKRSGKGMTHTTLYATNLSTSATKMGAIPDDSTKAIRTSGILKFKSANESS